jgi:ABC-type transport system involved in multi-copper enzyme maturation permease subunit
MKKMILSVPVAILMLIGFVLVGLSMIPFGLVALIMGRTPSIKLFGMNLTKTTENEKPARELRPTDRGRGRFA